MTLIILLAALVTPLSAAVLYMHPVNPALHPPDMYPIQREMRDQKIRDLPQSGIVYLKKIKPISDEFLLRKSAARDDQTFINKIEPETLRELPSTSGELKELHNTSVMNQDSQENIDYSVYDEKETLSSEDITDNTSSTSTASTTTSTTTVTTTTPITTTASSKSMTKTAPTEDLSQETLHHLDNLLAELTVDSNPKISKALLEQDPDDLKAIGNFEKPSTEDYKPKIVTLTGSAHVHQGSFYRPQGRSIHSGSAKLVRLHNSNKNTHGLRAIPRQLDNADFDPWERMDQRL